MKAMAFSFLLMLRKMKSDAMLIMLTVCPFFMGLLFRFGIPIIEHVLTDYFGFSEILTPYYPLFDTFLVIVTPSMFYYAAAMVMLEESDDRVAAYLSVTPLGKTGYLFSRLGFTGLIAFLISIAAVLVFHLAQTDVILFLNAAFAGTIQSVIVALLIAGLSKNKVEGMAVGKFASLLSLGALIPFFVNDKVQFFASVSPSFWIGKMMRTGSYISFFMSLFVSFVWITVLSSKFIKKIAG